MIHFFIFTNILIDLSPVRKGTALGGGSGSDVSDSSLGSFSKIHGRNRNFKLYMNDNISEIFNTVSVLIKPVPQL